jgi:hypothetical protein
LPESQSVKKKMESQGVKKRMLEKHPPTNRGVIVHTFHESLTKLYVSWGGGVHNHQKSNPCIVDMELLES